MSVPDIRPELSGERFRVHYLFQGDEATALEAARDLCVEQTIEFPLDLTPPQLRGAMVGEIESWESITGRGFRAVVSYAVEICGFEMPQLLNVLFGNSSLKPGVRLERLDLPAVLTGHFSGPRFGRAGLRKLLGVPERPLLCTALKPMGLDERQLADLARQFALGGIDIVKDDHGLADQPFAPFHRRVELCATAVRRANEQSGENTIYMPNISGPADEILDKARFARDVGAGGVLIAPGLVGPDTLRNLAADDEIALPLFSHPALLGAFTASPTAGISPFVLYGQLMRLMGADAVIFPGHGGRFTISREECLEIAAGTESPLNGLAFSFPAPGGGQNLERIPEMISVYGRDVILLIGGALHRYGTDLISGCRLFRAAAAVA